MAITLPEGFVISSGEAVDSRLVLTKEQMKQKKPAAMPTVYLCMCQDDRKLYIFDSSIPKAEADLSETGRFRPVENYLNFEISPQAQANIDVAVTNAVTESTTVQEAIEELVEQNISVNGGLIVE